METPERIRSREDLNRMASLVAKEDRLLAQALRQCGPLGLRNRPANFGSLLRVIVSQQVSAASASAIWRRVADIIQPMSAQQYLRLTADQVEKLGLTQQKRTYVHGLASEIVSGQLSLRGLHRQSDQEAIERLCKIKGIGQWTAEVFVLFSLGRPDILPTGDLALQEAAKDLYELPSRPSAQDFELMGKRWAPYRGIAAHILWAYYRQLKGMPPAGPV
jgi:DNA-3-methyladenine glycosylase II